MNSSRIFYTSMKCDQRTKHQTFRSRNVAKRVSVCHFLAIGVSSKKQVTEALSESSSFDFRFAFITRPWPNSRRITHLKAFDLLRKGKNNNKKRTLDSKFQYNSILSHSGPKEHGCNLCMLACDPQDLNIYCISNCVLCFQNGWCHSRPSTETVWWRFWWWHWRLLWLWGQHSKHLESCLSTFLW